ncbi:SGNH hydrolase domain-containing protein [Synechococcus sp. RS9902]|uniref:SGNH hydrolase domain-containing protein n=1 Tax=Synechococcus sp. RS9902 TaxID=221345 RepID=UPI00164740B2|nr:SGNH hydrolase domain-containing protein [Synechococcus sp. RS9902]
MAEKSADKGIEVIIFNSIRTFPNRITGTSKQWFNSLSKRNIGVDRKCLTENYRKVNEALNDVARSHSNVKIFDICSELCPESKEICTPEKYKDQWHLSKSGSLSLRKGLLNKLN